MRKGQCAGGAQAPHDLGRRRLGLGVLTLIVAVVGLMAAGCGQNELGRYTGYRPQMWVINDPKRIRNDIVKSENYWIQKEVEPEEEFPGPTPGDLKSPEQDYILGPGDLIDITTFELMLPGQPYLTRQRISQSGQITFPYLGTIKCGGLTTRGLEEKLSDLLEPDYLADPQVTVFVQEYRNLNVSVLNGVMRPGIYPMSKQDMTLLDLVAMAGGVLQLVEDYGYVIREYTPEEADLLMIEGGLPGAPAPESAPEAAPPAAPAAPVVPAAPAAPAAEAAPAPAAPAAAPAPAAAKPADAGAKEILERMAAGDVPPVEKIEKAEAAAPDAPPPAQAVEQAATALAKDEKELGRWVWSDGKWVEVKPEGAAAETAPPAPTPPQSPPEGTAVVQTPVATEAAPTIETAPVAVAAKPENGTPPADAVRLALAQKLRRLGVVQGSGQLKRIIRFDVKALQAGDPTQNLVLRDSDVITIPSPPVGDFYMAGEVARPGVYSLTGRKITLLQAVAAAGGVTAVAVPWRTELVRRISEDEEEIIYVDLGKVSRGEVPDFYLQPEDIIRVGTDQGAIYNAVLRNAFRATYGLGGVYDMNFADFYPWTDTVRPIFDQLF